MSHIFEFKKLRAHLRSRKEGPRGAGRTQVRVPRGLLGAGRMAADAPAEGVGLLLRQP